jgi:hypothetical protein
MYLLKFLLFVFVERRNRNCVHLGSHFAAPWILPPEAAEPLPTLSYAFDWSYLLISSWAG